MDKVMVTGVAGFVGNNLAKALLEKGYTVVGIDNFSYGTKENVDKRVEFHRMDIRDKDIEKVLKNCDACFHLAAWCSLPACLKNPVEATNVNVDGTANILEATRKCDLKKFVYAGSSCTYEGTKEFPTPESEKASPLEIYGVSKYCGELYCNSYSKLYGLDITITRYMNVYGPTQDYRRINPPLMSAFIKKMLNGEPPTIYGDGEQRRDFVFVDDVNDLNIRILENKKSRGQVFNVGAGKNYSVNEVLAALEKIMKTGLKPQYGPPREWEARVTLADVSKAKELLGWQPTISLQEGLQKSIDYLKEKIGGKTF